VNGHKAGHFVKIGQAALQIAGKVSEHGRKSLHGLTNGDLSLNFDQLGGFLLYQGFKVFSILPELLTHTDFFMGPAQGDFENIIVDGFGDKINGPVFEAFNRQVHVTVAGNHNDFRVGTFVLYGAEEFDAVHHRHFNVGQNNGRVLTAKYLEGFFTVFGCEHLIAEIG